MVRPSSSAWIGDKGYIRPQFKTDCEAVGIDLQTPVRKNMIEPRPRWWLMLLRRVRQRVETGISQLEPRFGLAKTRARDAWHLTNQVTRKLLAPTVGVWLNIQQGRESLQLDGVVTASPEKLHIAYAISPYQDRSLTASIPARPDSDRSPGLFSAAAAPERATGCSKQFWPADHCEPLPSVNPCR